MIAQNCLCYYLFTSLKSGEAMRKFFLAILLSLICTSCAQSQPVTHPPTEPFPHGIESPTEARPSSTPSLVPTVPPPHTPAPITLRWLIFVSYRDDYPVPYAMKEDGSGLTQLIDSLSGIGSPSWSPDGKKILFHAHSPYDGVWDIFVMNSDGSGL